MTLFAGYLRDYLDGCGNLSSRLLLRSIWRLHTDHSDSCELSRKREARLDLSILKPRSCDVDQTTTVLNAELFVDRVGSGAVQEVHKNDTDGIEEVGICVMVPSPASIGAVASSCTRLPTNQNLSYSMFLVLTSRSSMRAPAACRQVARLPL